MEPSSPQNKSNQENKDAFMLPTELPSIVLSLEECIWRNGPRRKIVDAGAAPARKCCAGAHSWVGG